jgi:excisionase family DNA binding protein
MSALTVSGVAARWQTSEAQVYQLIRVGHLKAFKIGRTRGLRVSETELQRWENGESNGAISGTASPSNGGNESPLPVGAMKALAAGGA